ncbi:MAG: M23 family metallopeptidase [Deltaproteobacteria bacterium]|nr:M23 family metallopeptidase [Deltaproteobacteria bacterium]
MAFGEKPKRSRAPFFGVVFLVGALGVGYAVWSAGKVGGEPVIVVDAPASVGDRAAFSVSVSEPLRGIVDVVVTLEGAGIVKRTLGEVHNAPPASPRDDPTQIEAKLPIVVGKSVLPELTEGTLKLTITATRAGSWLRKPDPVTVEKTMIVRLTPPTVTPMSSFVHVAQGGSEVIVYEVGPTSVSDGVVVAHAGGPPWTFRGFPLPGGPATRHFAFFALPYDDTGPEADVKARVTLFAQDELGNRSTAPFVHKYLPRPMGTDTIELKDPFLQKVTAEIFAQTPSLSKTGVLLDDYLVLNRKLRETNNAFLLELAQKSQGKFFFSKTFQPFGDASIKGAFADRRTYTRDGAAVDTQDHLGFDLARVERTPVNAGNDGVTAFAGYFGIYGNCVIIDHGFGVMTLYAHLSSMSVKEGDVVTRGQTLGLTGATGLAGGDHLHFTTLVGGYAVNPIEWWDGHWMKDRVKLKLGDAFPFDQ